MVTKRRKKRVEKAIIPVFEDRIEGDYVDSEHDYIVTSRNDHMVDVSNPLKPRRIKRKKQVRNKFDSNKTRYGNANIERLPVVKDSEQW